jgi:hypothetical protein
LNLLPYHPTNVGRWRYLVYWAQVNSTLTLTSSPRRGGVSEPV